MPGHRRRVNLGKQAAAKKPARAESSAWTRDVLHTVKHEGYEPFWEKLVAMRNGRRGQRRKAADKLLHYVAQRQDMIAYDEFLKHGWDIGTGPMEAQCKATTRLNSGDGTYTQTFIYSGVNLSQVPAITGNTVAGYAMNDAGTVVGASLATDGAGHAFIWQGGATADLGKLASEQSSSAVAINNGGVIVGVGYHANGLVDALLWDNAQIYNLQDLVPADSGWTLWQATGISDDGSVVGVGLYEGQSAAFLLTPISSGASFVPEPATLPLLALAAVSSVLRRPRPATRER